MKQAGSWLVALGSIALAIFFLQVLAMVIAPGIMAAYLYIVGTKKLFDWRDGSIGAFLHVGVGLALALGIIWFLFTATGLYKSYFV